VGEWQEILSLAHPGAEHSFVALPTPSDLFNSAKVLFVEANALQQASSLADRQNKRSGNDQ
jgi:hypothetical protein